MFKNITKIVNFYAEGFRHMTWGRPLWGLIILKVIILFLVLRCFFFKPILSGKSDKEKSEYVGIRLLDVTPTLEDTDN